MAVLMEEGMEELCRRCGEGLDEARIVVDMVAGLWCSSEELMRCPEQSGRKLLLDVARYAI